MGQLAQIIVYCGNVKAHKQWSKNHSKIVLVTRSQKECVRQVTESLDNIALTNNEERRVTVAFWTFVGIKILQQYFASDKAKWKLVVAKAKKCLAQRLGLLDIKKVDALLT
jgi:hypothetical protein